MRTYNFREHLIGIWQLIIGYGVALVVVGSLLFYRLGSLVSGLSGLEQDSARSTASLHALRLNPLFGPYKFLQFVIQHFGHHSAFALRLPSVLIALVISFLFYQAVRLWFDQRIAIITTALFVCSSWFLHSARLGTPAISYLSIIAAITYGAWLQQTKHYLIASLLGVGLLVWFIYTPGLVWFAVAGVIWQRRRVGIILKASKIGVATAVVLTAVLLSPLIFGLLTSPSLIQQWLGLPAGSLSQISHVPLNLLRIPWQILVRGPSEPAVWLGHMPLLDIFDIFMAVLGLYSFSFFLRLDRTKTIFASTALGMLLISLGGAVGIQLLLPIIFLLVAAGIGFMLEQWFRIFPRNPFARGLAVVIIALSVLTVGWFNVQSYYVAWSQTPATKDAYGKQMIQ